MLGHSIVTHTLVTRPICHVPGMGSVPRPAPVPLHVHPLSVLMLSCMPCSPLCTVSGHQRHYCPESAHPCSVVLKRVLHMSDGLYFAGSWCAGVSAHLNMMHWPQALELLYC